MSNVWHSDVNHSSLVTNVPDVKSGSFPRAVILGIGKCGTNAVKTALKDLGLKNPRVGPKERQLYGHSEFFGEVNWRCNLFETEDGLRGYKAHFSPASNIWFDQSTSEFQCAKEMTRALPNSTRFLLMLCDPMRAVWARMNEIRYQESKHGQIYTTPEDLLRYLPLFLQNNTSGMSHSTLHRHIKAQLAMRYESIIDDWKKFGGDRIRFLLTEHVKTDYKCMLNIVSSHLGIRQRNVSQVPRTRIIHSHRTHSSYLHMEGVLWETYINMTYPLFKPTYDRIRARWPDLFEDTKCCNDCRCDISDYWMIS